MIARPRVWADEVSRADPRHAVVLEWLGEALTELDPERAAYRADYTMAIELLDEGRIRILCVPDAGPGFLEPIADLRSLTAACSNDGPTGVALFVLRAHTLRSHPPRELIELLLGPGGAW